MWVPSDGSEEWLSKADGELALQILGLLENASVVGEVGVWKGAWASVILKNCPRITTLIGVDPFPNADEVRQTLLQRVGKLGLGKRFTLVESFDGIPGDLEFDLIHVDGMHTERQATFDLVQSAARLSDNGVLVLDDYSSPWFPGVQSAMYLFLREEDFRVFMVSPNKAYLARPNAAEKLWSDLRESRKKLNYSRLWENWAEYFPGHRYVQETTVMGQPVLVCHPF